MGERKYYITIENETVAENVTLDDGLLFIKALAKKYCNEHETVYAICEMPVEELMEE